MQSYHSASSMRIADFTYSVCHFSRAPVHRPELRLVSYKKDDATTSPLSSYCFNIGDATETQPQPSVEPPARTLKSAYSVKHAQRIRRLSHALFRLADREQLILLAFTLTFPGGGDEVALACEQRCWFAVRSFLSKLKKLNSGKTILSLCVKERTRPNSPPHSQGFIAIRPELRKLLTVDFIYDHWSECVDEQSQSTGVNLREGADGVINKKAHVYLEPVNNRDAYAAYLSKAETKTPLVLADGKTVNLCPWVKASRLVTIEAKKTDVKCHFQAPSLPEGLRVIDEEIVPMINGNVRSEIRWHSSFDTHRNRRMGVRAQINPAKVKKVGKVMNRFQKDKLRNQVAYLHCPDIVMKLDVAGNLHLFVHDKKLARRAV